MGPQLLPQTIILIPPQNPETKARHEASFAAAGVAPELVVAGWGNGQAVARLGTDSCSFELPCLRAAVDQSGVDRQLATAGQPVQRPPIGGRLFEAAVGQEIVVLGHAPLG